MILGLLHSPVNIWIDRVVLQVVFYHESLLLYKNKKQTQVWKYDDSFTHVSPCLKTSLGTSTFMALTVVFFGQWMDA